MKVKTYAEFAGNNGDLYNALTACGCHPDTIPTLGDFDFPIEISANLPDGQLIVNISGIADTDIGFFVYYLLSSRILMGLIEYSGLIDEGPYHRVLIKGSREDLSACFEVIEERLLSNVTKNSYVFYGFMKVYNTIAFELQRVDDCQSN